MKKGVWAIASLLGMLAGCSNYSVHTNLDKENFVEYFKPDKVKIINKEQLSGLNYVELGAVEGEVCQVKSFHAEPTDAETRTDARRKAANMGANAIIFQGCMVTQPSNDSCFKVKLCFARALKITDDDLQGLR